MAWGGITVPPKPADEQVLMVWDQKTQVEHFVRQVRFTDAKEPFGFVVPTPSRPSLHEIEKAPWDLLTKRCNPRWAGAGNGYGIGLGSIGTIGHGSGAGRGMGMPPPVTVLEEKQLGDFKAFVLEANDAKGFTAWLKKNRFKSTPELEAWLGHYIELKFYFVALRYEGTQKQKAKAGAKPAAELISKTVHISFKTPNPYYPYLEPLTKKGTDPPSERKLQVWFVSDQVMQPVARYWGEGEASGSVVRPWTEAYPCDGAVEALGDGLDKELGSTTKQRKRLQVFADLKTSREGYGDVLLVPTEPDECAGGCAAQRDRMAKLLESGAELRRDTQKPSPGAAPEPYLAPAACSLNPQGNADPFWLWLGAPMFMAWLGSRRRRWAKRRAGAEPRADTALVRTSRRVTLAALVVLGGLVSMSCEKTSAPSAPSSSGTAPAESPAQTSTGSVASPAVTNPTAEPKLELPADAVAAHVKLVSLLGGKLGGLSIPVQATDARTGVGAVAGGLPAGLPSAGALALRCTPGSHVEALIRVEIDHDAQGKPIRVMGPISDAAKRCIAQAIREAPSDGSQTGLDRFSLGFGPNTPKQQELQRRFAFTFTYGVGRGGKVIRIRMNELTVAGRLPKEVVQRIQRRYFGRYRYCVENDKRHKLKELTLSYVIDADGNVKNVRSKPDGGAAGSCIRKAFAAQQFPKPEGGVVTVSSKLTFEHPD